MAKSRGVQKRSCNILAILLQYAVAGKAVGYGVQSYSRAAA